ncbi:hypothetical protein ZWY2020_026926 [Hordeum vulgare]|nr:hypothetical protein ZWY2020_026926 [Hordeum vulgare]
MPVVTVLLYQDASTANDSVHLRFSPHTPASILPLPPSSRSYTGAILLTVVSHRYAASSAQERGGRKECARLLGTHDAGAASSHAPFSSPKRLLLLLASRPATRDLPRLPFDHLGRRIALSPTHILAMFLAYLRQLG